MEILLLVLTTLAPIDNYLCKQLFMGQLSPNGRRLVPVAMASQEGTEFEGLARRSWELYEAALRLDPELLDLAGWDLGDLPTGIQAYEARPRVYEVILRLGICQLVSELAGPTGTPLPPILAENPDLAWGRPDYNLPFWLPPEWEPPSCQQEPSGSQGP